MGEQRREETAGSRDKEVSVVENMESDIRVMQFNLLALEPKMHG